MCESGKQRTEGGKWGGFVQGDEDRGAFAAAGGGVEGGREE